MTAERIRARVVVSGRVQGVFFRQTTAYEARNRGVTGWVRNLPDGRVEAEFEGRRDAVEAMVAWSRSGPVHARVDAAEVDWIDPSGAEEFRIRD